MKALCALTLVLFVFASFAMGQAARTATLVGNVTDTTGAAVPGAKVVVLNTETKFESNGVTNAEGAYYIPFLAVGTYQLTIEAAGFKKSVQVGLRLGAGEVPRIDVRLEVGALTESVEVTGAVPLLQTETSQVSQTLQAETMIALPVLQLKAHRLLYYLEGVSSRGANSSVVGMQENQLGFTLDGISAKTSVRDSIGDTNNTVQPSLDALAEAKIYTTGAPAEIGHAAGGMLAFTFKSGTNALHGSAEDRYQHKSMIHRNYLEALARRNPYSFHQMQGTLSGPVIIPGIYDGKNKTFFLVGYGRHHEKGEDPQTGTVPDLAMLGGDFSFPLATGGGYPIYDPASIRQAGTTWTSDIFPNMLVPKNRFDKVATNFLALDPWKAPNAAATWSKSGPSNNWNGYTFYRSYRSRYDVKIDHQINDKNKFFVRQSYNRHRQWGRINGWVNNRLLDGSSFSFGRPNPIDQQNWAAADYHVFSPTFMNEFRVGFERRVNSTDPPTAGEGWAAKLGIPNVGPEHFPILSVPSSFGINPGSASKYINEDLTFQDNVTKVIGAHTVKFGYEWLRTRANNTDGSTQSGNYNFGASGLPFTPNTGNSFASFLLGSVTSASFSQNRFNQLPRWTTHSLYVQTDYKPHPNVTLNLGVRWSYESPYQTKYGQKSQFDPNTVDPISGKMGSIIHPTGTVYAGDWNNFQPRVGMAWHVLPRVVFRGSWGMLFQDRMPSGGFQEYSSSVNVSMPTGDPRAAFFLSQGPPNRNYVSLPDGTTPFVGSSYSGRSATYLDPHLRIPYVMNWSSGVQIDLGRQWMQELLYQGSAGVALGSTVDINQLAKSYFDSTDLTLLNAVYAAQQNYKPYTQFGSINYSANSSHSTYHGFTARVEKRYTSNGLTLNAHYTWSKSLSGGPGTGFMYYNWGLNKAPTGTFDTRHRVIFMTHYELPFGKGRKFMNGNRYLNAILGGWEMGWTQTFLSGQPINLGMGGSPYKYLPGQGNHPHQLVPDEKVRIEGWTIGPNRFPTSAQNPFYDISAFAYPAQFTAGTLGNNTQRGPWLLWPQWSLEKEWKVMERFTFSLRLDGNNIPVRLNLTSPGATVNINSPGSFGRFDPISTNSSQIGTPNGNMLLCFRLVF